MDWQSNQQLLYEVSLLNCKIKKGSLLVKRLPFYRITFLNVKTEKSLLLSSNLVQGDEGVRVNLSGVSLN